MYLKQTKIDYYALWERLHPSSWLILSHLQELHPNASCRKCNPVKQNKQQWNQRYVTWVFPLLKIWFFSPGYKCTHDTLLNLRCTSPVQFSESNPLQCQMRPIRSPNNQSFPATEPTSNPLIENKAPVDVRWSTPHNCSQAYWFSSSAL